MNIWKNNRPGIWRWTKGVCFIAILWFTFGNGELFAQVTKCNTTVDAGEDIELCFPGGEFDLIGEIITEPDYTIEEIEWSGPNIANPYILTTTASTNSTATYTLRTKIRQINLIFNGDFEQGNTGFISDYGVPIPPYSPFGPLGPEGTYMISNNPADTHTGFAPCSDHTGGNGNMMVINGNELPNARVWCQTITVEPDSDYEFSTWGTSVNPSNPARLQFGIDGVQIGDIFNLSPSTCQWNEFFQEWRSDNSGVPYDIEICIVNKNTQASGNDFALDDIYFGKVCEVIDEKLVEVIPVAEHTVDTLICEDESVTIHGETFTGEGLHGPLILEGEKGCDSLLSIDIHYIRSIPVIENPMLLTCDNPVVTISAVNSVVQPTMLDPSYITYQWTTYDGNILAGDGTSEIVVDKPGRYYLVIVYENEDMVCTSDDIYIEVIEDVETPDAEILVEQEDCTQAIWDLTAITSISDAQYNWTTEDGSISGLGDQSTILALSEGVYLLEVRNPLNGCVAYDTIELTLDGLNIDILGNLIIDCTNSTTTLCAQGSSEYNYEWFTEDGNIVGDTTADSILVDKEGSYQLISSIEECVDTSSVYVESFIDTIEINLRNSDTLNCYKNELYIEAEIVGAEEYSMLWSTSDGRIDRRSDTTTLTIDTAGIYVIYVKNEGGCEASDSIVIIDESNYPEIKLSVSDTLNCKNSFVYIDAEEVNSVQDAVFLWSTTDGHIVEVSGDEHQIMVDKEGTYFIELRDSLTGCTFMDSIRVRSDTRRLIVDAGLPDTLTCLQGNLQLGASVDSLQDLENIIWDTDDGFIISGKNTLTPTISSAGTYFITVKHSSSHCISQDSVKIYIDEAKPYIVPTGDLMLSCDKSTIIIDKTGSTKTNKTTHSWQTLDGGNILGGSDSYTVEIDASGLYVFTLIDERSGCESTDTIKVEEDFDMPQITLPLPDTLTCERIKISLVPGDLRAHYTYLWETVDGTVISDSENAELNVDSAGEYTLIVTDKNNGCTAEYGTEVLIDTIKPEIVVTDSFYLLCVQEAVIISADIVPENDLEIQWTTDDGNISGETDRGYIVADKGGTYTLSVRNQKNGCTQSAEVVVIDLRNIPILKTGPDLTITCKEPIVKAYLEEYAAKMGVYWRDENENILARNVDTFLINQPGIYYVEVVDDNFCKSRDSILVTEDISVEIVSAGRDLFIGCGKPVVTLGAELPSMTDYDFIWTDEMGDTVANKAEFSVDVAGTFQVTAVNIVNGCKSIDVVNVNRTDSIRYEYDISPPPCQGEKASFILQSLNGGLPDYRILLNEVNMSVGNKVNIVPGTYMLRIEDQLGCISEETLQIEDVEPVSLIYPSIIKIPFGDSLQITPLVSPDDASIQYVQWRPNKYLTCSDCLRPIVFPRGDMTYIVSLTDTNGCVVEAPVSLRIDTEVKYYIPNAFSPNYDGVNDRFWPRIGKGVEEITLIEVFNRWGDRVYRIEKPDLEDESRGWNGTFKGKTLGAGVFVYKVQLLLKSGEIRTETGTVTLLR